MEEIDDISTGYNEGVPVCGSESVCEIVNEFLNHDSRVLESYEILEKRKKEVEFLLSHKQEYLNTLREEVDKIVIEIYMLKNKTYG